MDINIETSDLGGIKLVTVHGDIDVYSSPKVKDALYEIIDAEAYKIVINLEDIRYIDSTGLGVLIGALKKVKGSEGNITVVCSNPQIKKVFTITGLVKIFGIYPNNDEAVNALKA
ncbi:MAG: STAS domain-containing protein [bacterium]|nr:STAS domain-containing protein [bacterium]